MYFPVHGVPLRLYKVMSVRTKLGTSAVKYSETVDMRCSNKDSHSRPKTTCVSSLAPKTKPRALSSRPFMGARSDRCDYKCNPWRTLRRRRRVCESFMSTCVQQSLPLCARCALYDSAACSFCNLSCGPRNVKLQSKRNHLRKRNTREREKTKQLSTIEGEKGNHITPC